VSEQCPLYPQKRTSELSRGMSALCQKRTLAASFNQLVGGDQKRWGEYQAERLRRFEVDDRRTH